MRSDNIQFACILPSTSLQMRPLRLSKQVIWGDIWQLPPRLKCLKHVMQDRQEKHD